MERKKLIRNESLRRAIYSFIEDFYVRAFEYADVIDVDDVYPNVNLKREVISKLSRSFVNTLWYEITYDKPHFTFGDVPFETINDCVIVGLDFCLNSKSECDARAVSKNDFRQKLEIENFSFREIDEIIDECFDLIDLAKCSIRNVSFERVSFKECTFGNIYFTSCRFDLCDGDENIKNSS